ncbi:MAG: ABC transporter substrate-binding protein [Alphaproteobacteria bacterium]
MFVISGFRIAALLLTLVLASTANAEDGITSDRILFGQSAALSGPAQALGQGMRDGIQAAFDEVNTAGGVHGRHLELVSRDDQYEPEAAAQNTRYLLFEHRVFALIGAVGTPTSKAAAPEAVKADTPYIGAFTGAELLRVPYRPEIVNLRASYFQETEALVAYLSDTLKKERIGVFFQNDSFGRAGRTGVIQALERRSAQIVSEGSYVRNSIAVKLGLLDVMAGQPDAVIMIGAYNPLANFIHWSAKLGFNPTFASISFIGSDAFAKALAARPLAEHGKGVIVSQVVPFPTNTKIPLVRDYVSAIRANGGATDFVSLEGYLAGRFAISILDVIGAAPTRAAFLKAVEGAKSLDVGGFPLSFVPGDSQGSEQVFLTELDGAGGLRPIHGAVP